MVLFYFIIRLLNEWIDVIFVNIQIMNHFFQTEFSLIWAYENEKNSNIIILKLKSTMPNLEVWKYLLF